MSVPVALILLGSLLVFALLLAGFYSWRTGKATAAPAGQQIVISPIQAGLGDSAADHSADGLSRSADSWGSRITLLQFSTEICAKCPATRRLLGAIADERPDVQHAEVDLTHRPDLAATHRILQTPTVFVLDAEGRLLHRIGGAPTAATVTNILEPLGVNRVAV
ncbi:TlpA family protein disulfide reductase [Lysinibacter cavernae]|uniref:Thiol-disulfide isomerase/thioredoxin n=1 Tax=Lysinibacter cavernae TaxID=1640652 RepID=A0A7X5TSZ7_9MICO|nr:thioredoxin family protein [Lysinibacter cavernae]NIH52192.1 thiol-disulfide isomerase/thioredoxin [Lysinibacter cavernae]